MIFKKICCLMLICIAMQTVMAATWSWETVDGVKWRYSIVNGAATIEGTEGSPGVQNYGTSVTVPPTLGGCPVTKIGQYAFYECKGLKHILLPDSLSSPIGTYAFYYCTNLEEVVIPSGVTGIGSYAFTGCGIKAVSFPDSVTYIGASAFAGCYGLQRLFIPGNIKTIGASAFKSCSNLTDITLEEGVISIGEQAFRGCGIGDKPNGIVIPCSVTSIARQGLYLYDGYVAFLGDCPSLGDYALSSYAPTTMVYVARTSSGFGSKIPGTWTVSYTINGTVFSAKYKIAYLKTIKFNANGGNVSAEDRYLVPGDAMGSLPTPTRTGYTFNGWYTATSGGTKISETTMVSTDITYYAHWSANQYTITFNANGGTDGTSKKLAFDTTLGVLPEPMHSSFDFGGWWTAASGGAHISESTKVTGAATYYAHWVDPIPELADTDSDAAVIDALASSADTKLKERMASINDYMVYRNWIDKNGLSHKAVRSSPNAWLSYVLDAPGWMAKSKPLANEDVGIEAIEHSFTADEAFDLIVNIGDVEIGEEARLAEVLSVEGATELRNSAFSSENVSVKFERTSGGKVQAAVVPTGSHQTFFMRVKVK